VIIDYKWETYTRNFFLYQLLLYSVYLVSFYWDMHTLYETVDKRDKNKRFWLNKLLGLIIHSIYLTYEALQAWLVRWDYLSDSWNLLQVTASIVYLFAAYWDAVNESPTDNVRMLYVACTYFTLSRVLYLIRVFKELSFLVIRLGKVMQDLTSFLCVFVFFIFTFS
jgi:hypothetical protein